MQVCHLEEGRLFPMHQWIADPSSFERAWCFSHHHFKCIKS